MDEVIASMSQAEVLSKPQNRILNGAYGPLEKYSAVGKPRSEDEVYGSSDIDPELVIRGQAGDLEALSQIYESVYGRVIRFVGSRLGSQKAEDAASEVMVRVLANIGKYQDRGYPFTAWVFRIARNEVVTQVRKDKVRARERHIGNEDFRWTSIEDESVEFPDPYLEKQLRDQVSRLAESQREVVLLRFYEGLSVTETAKRLDKTESTVKVTQHRAIAKLQTRLEGKLTA